MALSTRPARGDLVAGVSVGLVLIPQSLAYASLAGMPPERGLLVAVVATLAAAPLASSPWLQTGPVAVTSLLTLGALEGLASVGTEEYVGLGMLLALMVGAIRLVVGLAREGDVAYLLSRSVLAGFMPAAALVIALSQVPLALGSPKAGQLVAAAGRSLVDVGDWNFAAVALAVGSVVTLLMGSRRWPLFPSVVVVVVGGIIASTALDFSGAVIGDVPSVSLALSLDLPWGSLESLLLPALVIAIVGFGDTAAVARTYAAETRTAWDADREFVSQGAANVASALVGGFPAGGSFSRSAIGRMAGAKTTWSGAITGFVVLAFLPFVGLLAELPVSVLAGIIIASVAKLLAAKELRQLRTLSRPQFLIAVVTGVLTVALAPRIQWALFAGVAMAVAWHLRRETLIAVDAWVDEVGLHLRPSGVLYFGSAHLVEARFRELLAQEPQVTSMVLHCDRLGRVDVNGALEIRDLIQEAERVGVRTAVVDLGPAGEKILGRTLRHQNLGFDNRA